MNKDEQQAFVLGVSVDASSSEVSMEKDNPKLFRTSANAVGYFYVCFTNEVQQFFQIKDSVTDNKHSTEM